MIKTRITALLILLVGIGIGYFVYTSEPAIRGDKPAVPAYFARFPFRLGLDLAGGTHLVYTADVSKIEASSVRDSMSALRDIIERRVNLFGVSEPNVQVESPSYTNQNQYRLAVDLPGITDVNKAVTMIGQTPLLEFKTERPAGPEKDLLVKQYQDAQDAYNSGKTEGVVFPTEDPYYVDTQLTGKYLQHANVDFDPNTRAPNISITFNPEGSKLFAELTKANVNKTIAIYLDGAPISTPVVNEEITGGSAQITGKFSPQEAKQLAGRLNSGALPVPISLVSTQSIGASLGSSAAAAGVKAGVIGFLAIAIFLILWYRLPGLIAVVALSFYSALILVLFKLIPVTISAAGIAGFIVSLGIAVDANVLIFERIKEEIRRGHNIADAVSAGFSRAWFSIRDSNFSTIITAIILYSFGTSLIKGFALTLGIGVAVSLLSAVVVSRIFLFSLNIKKSNSFTRFLLGSGISNAHNHEISTNVGTPVATTVASNK